MFESLAEKLFLLLERAAHRFTHLRDTDVLIETYLQRHLYNNPKYADDLRLTRSQYQIYSQFGEDGMIAEIFARIGTTNRFFVEIGAGDGRENNTTSLLLEDWTGIWLEGAGRRVSAIRRDFADLIGCGSLRVEQALVTAENIEQLLSSLDAPEEPDLMSIDIDGNDYWVWKALERYAPRVLVIEYNALFRERIQWVMRYNPSHVWNGSSYFGASLKSLELLGAHKGYDLVGCNFHGINAFFVRSDLAPERFSAPFTAEHHFEPARYFLYRRNGHPRRFGPFERL